MARFASAADHERVMRVGSKLMCTCPCNQVLVYCDHPECPDSKPELAELEKMIDDGKSDDQILAAFVAKYGKPVLSAPTTSGFDLTAWIMPFIAFLIGASTVTYLAWTWRQRAPKPSEAEPTETPEYRDRIEQELKKYTPED